MAPSKSLDAKTDTPSQADTPMTDVNDEIPSIPVDNVDAPMTVSERGRSLFLSAVSGMGSARWFLVIMHYIKGEERPRRAISSDIRAMVLLT